MSEGAGQDIEGRAEAGEGEQRGILFGSRDEYNDGTHAKYTAWDGSDCGIKGTLKRYVLWTSTSVARKCLHGIMLKLSEGLVTNGVANGNFATCPVRNVGSGGFFSLPQVKYRVNRALRMIIAKF